MIGDEVVVAMNAFPSLKPPGFRGGCLRWMVIADRKRTPRNRRNSRLQWAFLNEKLQKMGGFGRVVFTGK
jgi:hypothetical protein